MTTISVRLSKEEKRALDALRQATGLTQTEVLRRSRAAYEALQESTPPLLRDAVREIDLGPGGYAIAPSTRVREAVGKAIRKKHSAVSRDRG